MKDYEIIVESMTPCGGSKHAIRTIIEAEAESPEEAMGYLRAGIDMVQCERFAPAELAAFVKEAKAEFPRAVIAAAGGINAANAAEYAATGVDVLVTSWVYFGKPEDIKMKFSRA